MNVKPLIGIAVICVSLAGCSAAGFGSSYAPDTFNLSAPSIGKEKFRRWPVQLTVTRPTAMRALDTDRIVVMSPGGRLSYYENSAWSDRLSNLVQARLVEAMQDAKVFRAILTAQDRVDGEFTLAVEIREFEVEIAKGRSEAVVTFFVKLIDNRRASVLHTKEFSARVPASNDETANAIIALQKSFNKATRDLVRWLASRRRNSA